MTNTSPLIIPNATPREVPKINSAMHLPAYVFFYLTHVLADKLRVYLPPNAVLLGGVTQSRTPPSGVTRINEYLTQPVWAINIVYTLENLVC